MVNITTSALLKGKASVASLCVDVVSYVEMTVINLFYDDKIYTKITQYIHTYRSYALPLISPIHSLSSSLISLLHTYAQVATGPPGAVNVAGSNPL